MPVETASQDRWLVSYADLLTLLFAFFVVMYSISQARDGDVRVLSESISAAFLPAQKQALRTLSGITETSVETPRVAPPAASTAIPLRPTIAAETLGLSRVAELVVRSSEEQGLDSELFTVRRSDQRLEIELNATLLYPSASAVLLSTAVPLLQDLSRLLAPLDHPIQVEGYSDNMPIATERYASNWELSAARAASVVTLFADAGVAPARLSILARAEQNPVASNDTEQGRSRNRRVVIALLKPAELQRGPVFSGPWSDLVKLAAATN